MKNIIAAMFVILVSPAYADIVSQDANGQISVQTAKLANLCVDSGSTTCGTIKAGIGSSNRVGINNTSPATSLDVTGTVTATAFSGPITGAVTGAITATTISASGTVTTTGPGGIANTFGITTGSVTATGGTVAVSTTAVGATPFVIQGAYSSAQILTLNGVQGQIIFNTTIPTICTGTGTVASAGAYVYISTAPTATLRACQ